MALPEAHAPFEALVLSLLSTDNAVRTSAEARLADAKAASPDALAAGALAVLRGSAALDARAFCAVLLRKVRERRVGRGAKRWPATAGRCERERRAKNVRADRRRGEPNDVRPPLSGRSLPSAAKGSRRGMGSRTPCPCVTPEFWPSAGPPTPPIITTPAHSSAALSLSPSQVLTRDEPALWPALSPAAQAAVKAGLLDALKEERERSTTRKVRGKTRERERERERERQGSSTPPRTSSRARLARSSCSPPPLSL